MKKFSTSFNGYNKQEVNKFVADIAKEYETMLNRLKLQDEKIENLNKSLANYQEIESALKKTILAAEDTSTKIKKLAREEGNNIIEEAKRNASRIVNDALIKNQEIEKNAEELRRRVIIFKRKFRQAIETEIEVINEIAEDY